MKTLKKAGKKITKEDVLHVAELANLTLSTSEVDKFLPQLEKILEYVNQLNEVDTRNTEPTSQTTGLANVLREDKIIPSSLNQSDALSGSSSVYNGYFKVEAILEGRTDK